MRCTGAILAGGRASRYGGAAKGLVEIGGRRIIDRVADALAASADEIVIVSSAPDADHWLPGTRVAPDVIERRASLVGVHTALRAAVGGVLVVAWDMPFVSGQLLRAMRELGERSGRAVVPESSRGPEPLCGYYPSSAAPEAERRIGAGELRLEEFVRALDAIVLGRSEVASFGDPDRLFLNVNDADEAAAADRLARMSER